MLTTTVYDVKVRYSVDGRGASGVRGITNEVKSLGRETTQTTGLLRRLSAAAVGVFSVQQGAKALIGFNATVQDTKTQIAGMLALTKKTDLSDQIANADRMYANLQRRAKMLPGTTAEYMQMLGNLTQPITDAGGGLKDLEDMTVNSVVAAKAFRIQWEVAARDMDQALRGQFHSVDQFTGKVLGSVGYKGEEGRAKFNAMSADQRLEVLRGALMQKQITQLAAAQGQTFNGALSTLMDTAEQFFGKVGLPLFKAITAEIKHWNTWLDANEDKVDAFAKRLADGLVTGFRYVKDVVTFIADHADTFLTIGKVWAAVKLGGMIGNFGSAGGSNLAERMMTAFGKGGWFRGASDSFNKETGAYEYTPAGAGRQAVGLKGAVGNLGLLTQSLAAGYSIGTVLNEYTHASSQIADGLAHLTGRVDETTDKFYAVQRSMDALDEATQRAARTTGGPRAVSNMMGAGQLAAQQANVIRDILRANEAGDIATIAEKLGYARQLGLEDSDITAQKASMYQQRAAEFQGRGDVVGLQTFAAIEAAQLMMTDYQKRTLDVQKAQEQVSAYIAQHLKDGNASLTEILHMILGATDDPTGKRKPNMAQKPNVNITIQRIEVQSDDPDRYAFGLVEAFRDAARNPGQAVRTAQEG